MADNALKIALTFLANDRTGSALGKITSNLSKIDSRIQKINSRANVLMKRGGGILAGAAAFIGYTARVFGDFEEGQVSLQSALLDSEGKLSHYYNKINKEAIRLGNLLDASTNDIQQQAAAMKRAGAAAASIANGGLDAAAKMASVLQLNYEAAGQEFVRMQQTLKVGNKDLVSFADEVQRGVNMGAGFGELAYGFQKVGGALDLMRQSGIEGVKAVSPLLTMMTKELGGEAGNALNEVLIKGFMLGKWKDVEGAVAYLDRLRQTMTDAQFAAAMGELFGSGANRNVAIKMGSLGVEGYRELNAEMRKMASLDQLAALRLGTLKSMFNALLGTMQNVTAAIGQAFAPELKALTTKLNEIGAGAFKWAEENRGLIRVITTATLALGGFMVTTGVAMKTVALARIAIIQFTFVWGWLTKAMGAAKLAVTLFSAAFRIAMVVARTAMISTGIGALVVGLGIGAMLLVQHWDKVKAFFLQFWQAIKPALEPVMQFFAALFDKVMFVVKNIGKVFGIGEGTSGQVRTVSPRGPAVAGSSSLNYAPVVNINGSANRDDIRAELARHKADIYRLTESERQRAARRGY